MAKKKNTKTADGAEKVEVSVKEVGDRRIFEVEVGDMNPAEAEEHVNKIMASNLVTTTAVELINTINFVRKGDPNYQFSAPQVDAWRFLGMPVVVDESVEPGTVVVKTQDGKRTTIKWS